MDADHTTQPSGQVLLETAPSAQRGPRNHVPSSGRGGHQFHKNPDTCRCAFHVKQRGEKKAVTFGDGVPTLRSPIAALDDAEQISADRPIITRNRSAKASVAEWAAMRLLNPQVTLKQAAAKIGISYLTLRGHIQDGLKEGWLKFDDPLSRLEYAIVPRVVDNLEQMVTAKTPQGKVEYPQVTMETAKHTIFKTYQEEHGLMDQSAIMLVLRIEAVEAAPSGKVLTGKILGVPHTLEAATFSEV